MKKTISIITLAVFLLATASAIEVIAGQNTIFNIGISEDVIWGVIGNSSDMNGMNLIQDGTNITVSFDLAYQKDNFTLIFAKPITKEVIKEVSVGGGGSSRTKYIYKNNTVYQNVEKVKTEYVDKIVETPKETNPTNLAEEPKDYSWLFYLGLALAMVVLIWIFTKLMNKQSDNQDSPVNNETEVPYE